MKNLFYRIMGFIKSKRNLDEASPIFRTDVVQEDTRSHEAVKRVKKAFDQQAEIMRTRALKKHGSDCIGILECTKFDCFEYKPDSIASEPYEVSMKTRKKVKKKS